jgi:ketosteroid isomerase-like protein
MSQETQIRLVRRLWEAVEENGLEAGLQLTDPDVEWAPHAAGGRVLTSQELLDFFNEFQGERQVAEARLYSVNAEGPNTVLASGSFRLKGSGGIAEFQIHFVYEFDEDRLVRGSTYATRADAMDAITRSHDGG